MEFARLIFVSILVLFVSAKPRHSSISLKLEFSEGKIIGGENAPPRKIELIL